MRHGKLYNSIKNNNDAIMKENRAKLKAMYDDYKRKESEYNAETLTAQHGVLENSTETEEE